MTVILYTIGYKGGLQADELRAWAVAHRAVVADVRLLPLSRAWQWRRPYLERVLGSRYRWVRDLGNLNYRRGPVLLAHPERGVEIVSAMLVKGPVALLCVCASVGSGERRCHRLDAADLIATATGATIIHLALADLRPATQLPLL